MKHFSCHFKANKKKKSLNSVALPTFQPKLPIKSLKNSINTITYAELPYFMGIDDIISTQDSPTLQSTPPYASTAHIAVQGRRGGKRNPVFWHGSCSLYTPSTTKLIFKVIVPK